MRYLHCLTLMAGCGGGISPPYATSGVVKSSSIEATTKTGGPIHVGDKVLVKAYIEPDEPSEAAVSITYIVDFLLPTPDGPVSGGSHALFGEFEAATGRVMIEVEMEAPAYPGTYKLQVSHAYQVPLAETTVVVVK